jgi:hypothetical protein
LPSPNYGGFPLIEGGCVPATAAQQNSVINSRRRIRPRREHVFAQCLKPSILRPTGEQEMANDRLSRIGQASCPSWVDWHAERLTKDFGHAADAIALAARAEAGRLSNNGARRMPPPVDNDQATPLARLFGKRQ